jgi:hypothetical protein
MGSALVGFGIVAVFFGFLGYKYVAAKKSRAENAENPPGVGGGSGGHGIPKKQKQK